MLQSARSKSKSLQNATAISSRDLVEMALANLWHNKLRSGLTMVGVMIGISSVIAITSIGEGVRQSTTDSIRGLGTDVLQVMAGDSQTGGVSQGQGSVTTLTWEDAQAIAAQAPSATTVAPYLQRRTQVVYSDKNTATTVYGTDLNYQAARNTFPRAGRYFNPEELTAATSVAVLAPTVQKNLFPAGVNPIGQKIRIQGEVYLVIGVMEAKGSQGPQDRDDAVFIPLTSLSARIIGNNSLMGTAVDGIYIKGQDESQLEAIKFQVANILRLRHNIFNPADDDFRIVNQADILQTFNTILSLLTLMIVAIAGISLVVGGIGIASQPLKTIAYLQYRSIFTLTSSESPCSG